MFHFYFLNLSSSSFSDEGGRANSICCLPPLDAVLSSGLCGKEGALPAMRGLTVQINTCCKASYWSVLSICASIGESVRHSEYFFYFYFFIFLSQFQFCYYFINICIFFVPLQYLRNFFNTFFFRNKQTLQSNFV